MERHENIDAYWAMGVISDSVLQPYFNKRLFVGRHVPTYDGLEIKEDAGPQSIKSLRIYVPARYWNIATFFCRKFNYIQECYKVVGTLGLARNQSIVLILDAIKRNLWFHCEIMEAWFRAIEKDCYGDKDARTTNPKGLMTNHRNHDIESWMRQEFFLQTHHPAEVATRRHDIKMNINVFAMGSYFIFYVNVILWCSRTISLLDLGAKIQGWALEDVPSVQTMQEVREVIREANDGKHEMPEMLVSYFMPEKYFYINSATRCTTTTGSKQTGKNALKRRVPKRRRRSSRSRSRRRGESRSQNNPWRGRRSQKNTLRMRPREMSRLTYSYIFFFTKIFIPTYPLSNERLVERGRRRT
jgi:hypothetical protein